jgi:hypothetical protein
MNNVGDFFRRVFGFLVSSPRRKFANRVGRYAGMIALLLSIIVSTCVFTSEWGFLSCMPASIFLVPIALILEFIGIDGPRSLGFVFYTVGTSLFYYIVGYLLGAIFFRENKSVKTRKKKN